VTLPLSVFHPRSKKLKSKSGDVKYLHATKYDMKGKSAPFPYSSGEDLLWLVQRANPEIQMQDLVFENYSRHQGTVAFELSYYEEAKKIHEQLDMVRLNEKLSVLILLRFSLTLRASTDTRTM